MTSNSLYSVNGPNSPGAQVPDQGAIYQQKKDKAQKELEKILGDYRSQYDNVTDRIQKNSQYASVINTLNSTEGSKFLEKDLVDATTQADVVNRLNELATPMGSSSWMGFFVNILYWILAITVVVLVITKAIKYMKPRSSVILGGNRLTTK